MCGILGIATTRGAAPSLDDDAVARLRDLMTHRGPDDAGLWRLENVVLAHRRLAVIDTSPAGRQPMVTPDGRAALVYNGELYNHDEIRDALARAGRPCATRCDAEAVLLALDLWGEDALARFRGMYALGFYDARRRSLLLARDPLGIKPLYWALVEAAGHAEVVFASQIPPILAHPRVRARPDLACVSAYLSTIRVTLARRTLFAGVSTLLPGESIRVDLAGDRPVLRHERPSPAPARPATAADSSAPTPVPGLGTAPHAAVRAAVADSVERHLRADVPACCLLSGGLDSSIVAALAARRLPSLHTYCAGTPAPGAEPDDLSFARLVASHVGARHAEAPVSRDAFAQRWPRMIADLGVPLSTPNEVAIFEVARRLRADGMVVALTGEGADELFAGYELPMLAALRFESDPARSALPDGARARAASRFQVDSNAWVPVDAKPSILAEWAGRASERDAHLLAAYEEEFSLALHEPSAGCLADSPLERSLRAHLRFHRRINLAGLLLRLDSATMLASVEGRTPLADEHVRRCADALPMRALFRPAVPPSGLASPAAAATKVALREAFADDLPPGVLARPKASFPLPFQPWLADHAVALRRSAFARELFTPAAIDAVAARPADLWPLAWPMINVALWGERWL